MRLSPRRAEARRKRIADADQPRIQLLHDRVVKRQEPEHSAMEAERTRAGRLLGQRTGLFRVPEVFEVDAATGKIVFERLPYASSVRELLVTQPDPALMARAAEALASIHTAGKPASSSDVTWHGDFGFANLLFSNERDELSIIDWSNAAWTGEPSERSTGPAGHDLGIALISLFHARMADPFGIAKPEVMAQVFLQNYLDRTDARVLDTLHPFMRSLSRTWLRHRLGHAGAVRFAAYYPSVLRLLRFVRRFGTRQ